MRYHRGPAETRQEERRNLGRAALQPGTYLLPGIYVNFKHEAAEFQILDSNADVGCTVHRQSWVSILQNSPQCEGTIQNFLHVFFSENGVFDVNFE